jgi:MFS family permease
VAAGFALFVRPGVASNYWTTFFPAVVVLGLGMAISVAPLTTTVMNSVPENRAGIASGINNAVSRTAGLLAIAVLGLVMFQAFDTCLNQRLDQVAVAPSVRAVLRDQRLKLAAAEIPPDLSDAVRNQVRLLIDECFVQGFRWVMACGALLALASSLTSLVLIESRKRTAN